ncbi:DUF4258 domain-containing protein [Nioella sp. MMSF_3534]|jgi:hypothetical protein|uniref:DUF4258 domain-containing protein n=1 Tax=Nioella sp. MMSF_3534 TaxID=3046720 RepID=UPI003531D0C1
MSRKPDTEQKVLPLRQRPHEFLRIVRRLAEDSTNIAWSEHARERFSERGITNRMALSVLRSGYISGDIVPGNRPGEWKAKLLYQIPGRREMGVVMILVKENRIFVKTVMWED